MTGGRCYALLRLGLMLLLVSGRPAEAVNPETLLMPGKLSSAHVKYEEQCSLCHDRTDRNRQTQLRLAIAIGAVVAQRALLFVFHVSGAQLARHQERLRIHGFSGSSRYQ